MTTLQPETMPTNGTGPTLDETDPDLIHALTVLSDRFGWLGIQRVVALIVAEHGEYAATAAGQEEQ